MMGDQSLVQLLLDRGADPKLCNERGDSPADLARVNGAMVALRGGGGCPGGMRRLGFEAAVRAHQVEGGAH
eukprot:Skav219673  [mRNA]  locus=scaffold3149:145263:145475:+ [translate_table: standard]